jgi:hypothetical protein
MTQDDTREIADLARQFFTQQYQQYQQQATAQQQAQSRQSRTHMWMWNGVGMTIEDFAEQAYGDTPEATHFLLKYKETI